MAISQDDSAPSPAAAAKAAAKKPAATKPSGTAPVGGKAYVKKSSGGDDDDDDEDPNGTAGGIAVLGLVRILRVDFIWYAYYAQIFCLSYA